MGEVCYIGDKLFKEIIMGVIELWTIISIILHYAGVGDFKDWPVIASPTTWSCMCLELWVLIVYAVIIIGVVITAIFSSKR